MLAIEPMVAMGTPETRVLADGWTAVTRDGSLAAHFEHTVAVTAAGPLVLTARHGDRADVSVEVETTADVTFEERREAGGDGRTGHGAGDPAAGVVSGGGWRRARSRRARAVGTRTQFRPAGGGRSRDGRVEPLTARTDTRTGRIDAVEDSNGCGAERA